MPLDGAGGRHEDAGGEGEVTEALQHQVEAGGQGELRRRSGRGQVSETHLQSNLQTYHEAAEQK